MGFDLSIPNTRPITKEEGEKLAKMWELMYKESHPNGPYKELK
jgi:hypothetical protein